MKKSFPAGPSSSTEAKMGKNVSRANYQEKFQGKKMASGGAIASVGNVNSKPGKSDMDDLGVSKARPGRGSGAATRGTKSYGPMA